MTEAAKKTDAILEVREFLYALTDKKKTPRVPKVIREQALEYLKVYPWGVDAVYIERGLKEKHER